MYVYCVSFHGVAASLVATCVKRLSDCFTFFLYFFPILTILINNQNIYLTHASHT